jgi:hypothetical protein
MRAPDTHQATLWVIVLFVAYMTSYFGYRATHREVWGRDGKTYLVFGSPTSFSFYRPLCHLDGEMTGIRVRVLTNVEEVEQARRHP